MKLKQVYAGIITYNPDMKILDNNIQEIINQVSEIVIVDNASENPNELSSICNKYKIHLISNKQNYGIAKALNQAMSFGFENNYEWMLTLDQDSSCNDNHVASLLRVIDGCNDVGIIAPIIRDRDSGTIGHHSSKQLFRVNTCISSGSLVNVQAWNIVGHYDDDLFIDSVDFDLCYRLNQAGYGVYQTNEVTMTHKIGESTIRYILGHKVIIYNHNSSRKYYIARNSLYVQYKNRRYVGCARALYRNIRLCVLVLLFENNKSNKVKAILSGTKDGIKMIAKKCDVGRNS